MGLTLTLIIRALSDLVASDEGRSGGVRGALGDLGERVRNSFNPDFSNPISIKNLRTNFQRIRMQLLQISDMPELTRSLLDRCEVACFVLTDIAEAFQFFDSQNARGKDLEPHDLLKAYHLREFESTEDKVSAVVGWENQETADLAALFGTYLFRIRSWVENRSARHFGKDRIHLFKGVSPTLIFPKDGGKPEPSYPYLLTQRLVLDQLRLLRQEATHRGKTTSFPFQLDQEIIDGSLFFELVNHYSRELKQAKEGWRDWTSKAPSASLATSIIETLNSYPARYRTGDQHVRTLFDSLLFFYADKFGRAEFDRAVEKSFIWAYTLRLRQTAVRLSSVDNYVRENNAFRRVSAAKVPADFFGLRVEKFESAKSAGTGRIECLFRKMGYLPSR